jgi:antitoxin (DNA-binding transcriptional repressor) of toxin-antitoxin stability system
MTALNLEEINLNTQQLLDLARTESEVTICEHGQPRFKLIALPPVSMTEARQPGGWEGRVWIADDFDELPEEVAAAFRGELE